MRWLVTVTKSLRFSVDIVKNIKTGQIGKEENQLLSVINNMAETGCVKLHKLACDFKPVKLIFTIASLT